MVGDPGHRPRLTGRADGPDGPDALAAAAGDRDALARVLDAVAPAVWRIARRIMGNDDDAADASQEGLIAIARGIGGFDGRSSLSTWVHRVATNACLDELRRRNRRAIPVDDEILATRPATATADPELRVDIDRAMGTLRPEFRAVVVLRDVMGHDYETIASILDVPIGTVRSRLARARRALLADLALGGPEDSELFESTGRRREDGSDAPDPSGTTP